MKLRGIDFGSVQGASGVQGFFGEGYWFHKFLWLIGLRFDGMTFVAKTTTLPSRAGNMPMKSDGITPREWFPKSVYVDFWRQLVVNAVSLSGPGAKPLLDLGYWQQMTQPFFISFMSHGSSAEERLADFRQFVQLLKDYLGQFRAPVGLQINFSCPNIGLNLDELIGEASETLDIGEVLEIPLVPKFNALISVGAALEISKHRCCDAICISNTIPWLRLPEKIDWIGLFGSDVSPLRKRGLKQDGGLSGKLLLPIVRDWVKQARASGLEKPIVAGGGILCPDDVDTMVEASASAVFLGSIATLRPWNVAKTIKRAHELL